MKHNFLLASLGAGLLATACHPDKPATTEMAAPAATPAAAVVSDFTPPTGPLKSGDAEPNTDHDTLHVAGGGVLYLKPTTEAAFKKLPSDLPSETNYDKALTATSGAVRRQGDDLTFQPPQGPAVTLHNLTDETGATGEAVTYQYYGELPAAHQWLVSVQKPNATTVCLIDQRSGQRTDIVSWPAVSPDGRYLLSVSSDQGNDGSDEAPKGIQLFRLGEAAPQLLWHRSPVQWGATEARWAGPHTVLLTQNHQAASQESESPPDTFVAVEIPSRH